MDNCLWCKKEFKRLTLSWVLGISQNPLFCEECIKKLEVIEERDIGCVRCGRVGEFSERICEDCRWWEDHLPIHIQHTASFHYTTFAQEWMSRYKFEGDCNMARLLVPTLKALKEKWKDACVVPIPTSSKSLKHRGFHAVSYPLELAGIPHSTLLLHIGEGKKQSDKTKEERIYSEQPFICDKTKQMPSKSKRIVIVDDVFTTGATMRHAYQALLQQGFTAISSYSYFR